MINVDLKINCNCQAIISDYTNYQFKSSKTRLLIIYSFMGDMVAAQVQEDIVKDLSPEEIKKLFKGLTD